MKKSTQVLLSAAFIATTTGCAQRREWINGSDEQHAVRDTVYENVPYRYYRGSWFRVYHNGFIRAPYYMVHGAPGAVYPPVTHHLRAGGFGRMAHTSTEAAHS
jgi:hypothetical protein